MSGSPYHVVESIFQTAVGCSPAMKLFCAVIKRSPSSCHVTNFQLAAINKSVRIFRQHMKGISYTKCKYSRKSKCETLAIITVNNHNILTGISLETAISILFSPYRCDPYHSHRYQYHIHVCLTAAVRLLALGFVLWSADVPGETSTLSLPHKRFVKRWYTQ